MHTGRLLSALCIAIVTAAAGVHCAAGRSGPSYDPNEAGRDGPPLLGTEGGDAPTPCTGLQCQQVTCPSGGSTTVSGTVHTPATVDPDPLYDAVVYVPNAPVQPFTRGVACDHCGAPASGSPIVDTLTRADGSFKLSDVPVGKNIPLVIQLGRWRRQITVAEVVACQDNPLTDDVTHLPGKQADGDIPLMAIATGALDPLECVLRKIGIDDAEFTAPGGGGRVNVFVQNGLDLSPPAPPADNLWSSAANLETYDMVLFPCEGTPNLKPTPATQALIDYTTAGGRVFATHYSYVWIYDAPAPFPSTATWNPDQPAPADPLTGLVDTSFPKGQAMADWLAAVGASTSPGQIAITTPRHDVDGVTPVSQDWITSAVPVTTQHFTFNTPVGADAGAQCGKVVYSDFHVASEEANGTTFPTACVAGPLTAQEKVIEFMLFNLASCIQNEQSAPQPPPTQ